MLCCSWLFLTIGVALFVGAALGFFRTAFGFAEALFGHGGCDERFELGLVEFAVLVVILDSLVAFLLLIFGFGVGFAISAIR